MNKESSNPSIRISNLETGVGKSGGPQNTLSHPRSAIAIISLPLRRWYHGSALRLLFVEIRALVHRMAIVLQIRKAEQHRGTEEVQKWIHECLIREPYRCDYMSYMQQTKARMPLTIFDSLLVSHAWRSGWESHDLFCKSQNLADTNARPNVTPENRV
jgi:hypothetical protein